MFYQKSGSPFSSKVGVLKVKLRSTFGSFGLVGMTPIALSATSNVLGITSDVRSSVVTCDLP